jgi:ferrochelatase
MAEKTAVILFNLGGPDVPASVQPFLFNLFNDKHIIQAPRFIRWCLATMISRLRAPKARGIYEMIGGGSPIVSNTKQQADALQKKLPASHRVFICMRYWHPMTGEVIQQVQDWGAERIILLPLYPQFSTTTTGSSFSEWERLCTKKNVSLPTLKICCYPTEQNWIKAVVDTIQQRISDVKDYRFLFSAHGLPEKIINQGDPYQHQVEQTVAAVVQALGAEHLDYVTCYQSRVGPLKWIGPSTDEEIIRAGMDKKRIVLIPIAFVSEHSETLVELDIEYDELATESGVKQYIRIPTVSAHSLYIDTLATLIHKIESEKVDMMAHTGKRFCPKTFARCAMAAYA